jgi:hypothetical protein
LSSIFFADISARTFFIDAMAWSTACYFLSTMKHLALTFAVGLVTATAWAAGPVRAWQTGTWRDVQVVRPKVVFGLARRPGIGSPAPAIAEVRTYVIETDDLRLDLKENTTADAHRIDATVGELVTFALEKNTVYIKEADGTEHKLSVTKKVTRTKP